MTTQLTTTKEALEHCPLCGMTLPNHSDYGPGDRCPNWTAPEQGDFVAFGHDYAGHYKTFEEAKAVVERRGSGDVYSRVSASIVAPVVAENSVAFTAYNQAIEDAKAAIRAESQGGGYWAAAYINAIARRCSPHVYVNRLAPAPSTLSATPPPESSAAAAARSAAEEIANHSDVRLTTPNHRNRFLSEIVAIISRHLAAPAPVAPSSEVREPTPSCAECGAIGSVFIVEPSSRWFRIVHREACPWAAAFAPRGMHEVCVPVAPNDGSKRAQRLVEQWREANDWPGLVWSAQNLSDEPRWLAAWRDLEQRITTHAHQRYVAGLRDALRIADGRASTSGVFGDAGSDTAAQAAATVIASDIRTLLEKTNVAE